MNNWQAFYIGVGLATLVLSRMVVRTMRWKCSSDREEKL
jgi:hypothetical protein